MDMRELVHLHRLLPSRALADKLRRVCTHGEGEVDAEALEQSKDHDAGGNKAHCALSPFQAATEAGPKVRVTRDTHLSEGWGGVRPAPRPIANEVCMARGKGTCPRACVPVRAAWRQQQPHTARVRTPAQAVAPWTSTGAESYPCAACTYTRCAGCACANPGGYWWTCSAHAVGMGETLACHFVCLHRGGPSPPPVTKSMCAHVHVHVHGTVTRTCRCHAERPHRSPGQSRASSVPVCWMVGISMDTSAPWEPVGELYRYVHVHVLVHLWLSPIPTDRWDSEK